MDCPQIALGITGDAQKHFGDSRYYQIRFAAGTIYEGLQNSARPEQWRQLTTVNCTPPLPSTATAHTLCANVSGVEIQASFGDDTYAYVEAWIEGCPEYVGYLNSSGDLPADYCLVNSSNVEQYFRTAPGGVEFWVQDGLSWDRKAWMLFYANPIAKVDLKYEYFMIQVDSKLHSNFWGYKTYRYLKVSPPSVQSETTCGHEAAYPKQ